MSAESEVAARSNMVAAPGGSIWTDRNFVKLWTGETVSLIGNQITQFTLPLVAILTIHASTFQVGVLNACRTAPVVVVSLFAGVRLDRRRRRPILIACSLGNAALMAVVPISDAVGLLGIGLFGIGLLRCRRRPRSRRAAIRSSSCRSW